VTGYLLVAAVVFGVNLLPAFGPPTWAILVFFRLDSHLAPVPLVIVGALAAASGRLLLATSFRLLRGHLPARQTKNLEAAGALLVKDRKRSIAGLALFALSPVPSAQLFEAAGLTGIRLNPLTFSFFAGRLVSYSLYVAGASAAKHTSAGQIIASSFTSVWGIGLQILLIVGLVGLTQIDWVGRHERHQPQTGK
jgi:uncharacterized membrane protein YdjX (TVP38/TMEM64 family)